MLKKSIILLGGLAITSVILFGIYLVIVYNKVVVKPNFPKIPFIQKTTPSPTPDPMGPYSVLLLGYGGPEHDGGYLTDTMIVAYIIPREKRVFLIPLPRDLWVLLPVQKQRPEYFKINAAYAIGRDNRGGAGELARHAASVVTGLPVDYFVAISFDGFRKSIDTLGGVDVEVPHTFDDFFYPVPEEKENNCGKSEEEVQQVSATLSGTLLEQEFPCRYKHVHFDQGHQQMGGELALEFVRSRKSDQYGGDYNRSLRQQALLKAVKEKVISINFIPKIIPFISTVTSGMQTDISAGIFSEKLSIHPDIGTFEIKTISVTDDSLLVEDRSTDGQYILVPKDGMDVWQPVHAYIKSHLMP